MTFSPAYGYYDVTNPIYGRGEERRRHGRDLNILGYAPRNQRRAS